MTVLFVCSGTSKSGISPIVKSQGASLAQAGCKVSFFTIGRKGIGGYLSAIPNLRRQIRSEKVDIIHAHYSLSAFAATFAGVRPLVVSLMGSDVIEKSWYKYLIKIIARFCWQATIVKSDSMKKALAMGSVFIVPNGVDLNQFQPIDRNFACSKLGWASENQYVLFPTNPNRPEKNFNLARAAFACIRENRLILHYLDSAPISMMPLYYAAADVVILTSLWEGSPNVIKEAMACCRPIVATDVGDVRWVLGDTKGCYIASFDPKDFAEKIKAALQFAREKGRTTGRDRIIQLGLDAQSVARRIIEIYEKIGRKK